MARMEGVWRATAEVVIFLDSHIEATKGWIEPLLARIREDRSHVVVPSIDSVGSEHFHYSTGGGLGVLGFSWTLGQMPQAAYTGHDGAQPAKSPIMAGGLFASDRKWFLKLGGYDPEMRLYGGEEMEIGFRTWMCGGDIEYIPCSHVGHVFRTGTYWQGQVYRVPGEEIARNKLRAAEVWMDDYKALVKYATAPLPPFLPMGDIAPRLELRRRLQCKNFAWYLQNVVPDMFIPKLGQSAVGGGFQNEQLNNACLDTLGGGHDSPIGVYPCHFGHGSQALVLGGDGLARLPIFGYRDCMAARGSQAVISACDLNPKARWKYEGTTHQLVSLADSTCLEASNKPTLDKSPFSVILTKCGGSKAQRWFWTP